MMDFTTADGSEFSVREVWSERDGEAAFSYTSVTAIVDGKAYAGRHKKRAHLLEDDELAACLETVPSECIYPLFPPYFTRAPAYDRRSHYLKRPSFLYEDCQPAETFVADCLLNEAYVLEKLKKQPHANIVRYYGCVVKEGRITHLCLEKFKLAIGDFANGQNPWPTLQQRHRLLDGIQSGIKHLHELGLAHNDINPDNVGISEDGEAVIIDFDSCLPFGERLLKGVDAKRNSIGRPQVSTPENDVRGLDDIARFLLES